MNQPQKEEAARLRAAIILQVRSGQMTASAGAKALGVSRKTYYQWEKRALQGMMEQLSEQEAGRPVEAKDPQLEAMQARIAQLEAKLKIAEQTAEVRAVLLAMERAQEKRLKKKKSK